MASCNSSFYERSENYVPLLATSVLSTLGLPGNTLVILLIFRAKEKKSTTTCLLLSLAVADFVNLLIMDTVVILLLLFEKYCRHEAAVFLLTVPSKLVANVTLALIALERYNALVKTMKPCMRKTRRRIAIIIGGLWFICLPLFTLFMILRCKKPANPCPPVDGHVGQVLWFLVFFLGIAIPFGVVLISYATILKGLYIDGTVLGRTTSEASLNEKKRLVRVLLVITFVFLLFNFPAVIILLLKHYSRSVSDRVGWRMYYFNTLVYLSCMSSFLDPFVYGLQSENYRRQVKSLFCKTEEGGDQGSLPAIIDA